MVLSHIASDDDSTGSRYKYENLDGMNSTAVKSSFAESHMLLGPSMVSKENILNRYAPATVEVHTLVRVDTNENTMEKSQDNRQKHRDKLQPPSVI